MEKAPKKYPSLKEVSLATLVYAPVWYSSVLIVNSEGPSRDSENRWPSDRLQLYINVSGGQHRQHTAGTHHTTITISGLILVSW